MPTHETLQFVKIITELPIERVPSGISGFWNKIRLKLINWINIFKKKY